MNQAADFIRNFEPSALGLGIWGVWIGLGIVIVAYVVMVKLATFLPRVTSDLTRKILRITFYAILIGVISFMLLNSLLNQNYGQLAVIIFLLLLQTLRRVASKLYKSYDTIVDKVADRWK